MIHVPLFKCLLLAALSVLSCVDASAPSTTADVPIDATATMDPDDALALGIAPPPTNCAELNNASTCTELDVKRVTRRCTGEKQNTRLCAKLCRKKNKKFSATCKEACCSAPPSSPTPLPPPPSPPPAPPHPCCDVVSVTLSGGALSTSQGAKLAGQYEVVPGITQGGRAMYTKISGEGYNGSPYKIFYWPAFKAWRVGYDYTKANAWLTSVFSLDGFTVRHCPEDAGHWRYWNRASSLWTSGGIDVSCVLM